MAKASVWHWWQINVPAIIENDGTNTSGISLKQRINQLPEEPIQELEIKNPKLKTLQSVAAPQKRIKRKSDSNSSKSSAKSLKRVSSLRNTRSLSLRPGEREPDPSLLVSLRILRCGT